MRGGFIHVQGGAGARAAHRMRRGLILVEGGTGAYPGSEMRAGTLVILGEAGPHPGVLLRRGSIVLGGPFAPSPSFVDSGVQDFLWLRVLQRDLAGRGIGAGERLKGEARRFAGDMASLGRGEILALAM
jgi:formylmethanofuran dehydrogenase subunit C